GNSCRPDQSLSPAIQMRVQLKFAVLPISLDNPNPSSLSRRIFAPVAQPDRATDFSFKPNELRSVSLLCISLLMLGSSQFRFRGAFRRVAQFCIKILPDRRTDRRKFRLALQSR